MYKTEFNLDFLKPENQMSEGEFIEWTSMLINNLCNWTLKEIADYTALLVFHNQERLKACGRVLLLVASIVNIMKRRDENEVIQREIIKNAIEYLLKTNNKRLTENTDYKSSYCELTEFILLYIRDNQNITAKKLNAKIWELYDIFISEELDLGEEL